MADELAEEHRATTDPPDDVSTRVIVPEVEECDGVEPLPCVDEPEPSLCWTGVVELLEPWAWLDPLVDVTCGGAVVDPDDGLVGVAPAVASRLWVGAPAVAYCERTSAWLSALTRSPPPIAWRTTTTVPPVTATVARTSAAQPTR